MKITIPGPYGIARVTLDRPNRGDGEAWIVRLGRTHAQTHSDRGIAIAAARILAGVAAPTRATRPA